MERYQKALEYASLKHKGQTRKEGIPYITHPIAVSEYLKQWGYNEDYMIAGLFHDLLEDTDASEEDILSLSSQEVLDAVKCLTKTPGYKMSEYIEQIKNNEMAKAVKTADRYHNLLSAIHANKVFQERYIRESEEWYLDFSPVIQEALDQLKKQFRLN